MIILHKDIKQGIIKVKPTTPEDAWYLSTIIESGDHVSCMTERKLKISGSEEKSKIIKRMVFLTIEIEKIDYDGALRVSGKIVDGPDDIPRGDYHGLDIAEGITLDIRKNTWSSYVLKKLEESTQHSSANVLIVIFDREEARFVILKKHGYETILHFKGDVPKKNLEHKGMDFYKELAELIRTHDEKYSFTTIVLASPAFWKEYVYKEVTDSLKKKIILSTCSSMDERAITEVLKRPELKAVLEHDRSSNELRFLDDLFGKVSKDLAVYGRSAVHEKILSGNVEQLFVSENLIKTSRTNGTYGELDVLMDAAENANAELHIVSTDEAMKKLDGISGIAATQRWKDYDTN